MLFVFERIIKMTYEVEALDRDHAEERLANDPNSFFVGSIAMNDSCMVGTRISDGNIMPKRQGKKK